jgi:aspartate racemase
MKTIGLLGGTGWSSTIGYYEILNKLVAECLGGYHSAKIILKSIDYHDIMTNYGADHETVATLLKNELLELIALKPDCIIICCNSLHKYYDMIKTELNANILVMHAVELVADHLNHINNKTTLLLATKFTMDDGFFF